MRNLSLISCCFIGIVFLVSGVSKLFPIQLLEYSIVNTLNIGWTSSALLARSIISIEILLGIQLCLNKDKIFFINTAFILLLIFIIYLFYNIYVSPNSEDCGCFGEILKLSPSMAVIKNFVLIGMLFFSYKVPPSGWTLKKGVNVLLIIAAFTLPYIISPLAVESNEKNSSQLTDYPFEFDYLYKSNTNKKPKRDLRQGKHIIAFFSASCKHCKMAAMKLQIMKKRNSQIPFYIIINGDEEKVASFFQETRSNNIPYTISNGTDFIRMSGTRLPAIVWLDKGIVRRKSNYDNLSQEEIEEWLRN